MSEPSKSKNKKLEVDAVVSGHFETSEGNAERTHSIPLGDDLAKLSDIGIAIETALERLPQNAAQELAAVVRLSIAATQEILSDVSQVSPTTKDRIHDLYLRLNATKAHLQDRRVYGKRVQIKDTFRAVLGYPASPPPKYHLEVQAAFDALKDSLSTAGDAPPEPFPAPAVHTNKTPSTEGLREKATEQDATEGREKRAWRTTMADGVEGALRILSETSSLIPSSAGSIVKLMEGTGLTIIEMLKGMDDNKEQAIDMGRHIGTLIQTAGLFLEDPETGMTKSCDQRTINQLQSFFHALKVLEQALAVLNKQGHLKQGISHKSNRDDLRKWDDMINRAFAALQTQLSLDSLRLITNMSAVDALRERDRIIALLGDGDTGATDKAADPANRMCLPGTRMEVLAQLDRWIASPSGSRILWLSGVAGCGKSAVAATIGDRRRSTPASTAIFHFARGNQPRNKKVILALSRQLTRWGHGSLEHFILSELKANPDIATAHLTTQFRHLIIEPLKKLVPGSQTVILVLDALDEWDNEEAAVTLIEHIGHAHAELPSTVRFILTSRNQIHLVNSLECDSMKHLVARCPLDEVPEAYTNRDIRSYVEMRFAKISDRSRGDGVNVAWPTGDGVNVAWPTEENIERLVELSGGLFQWASTVMSYVGATRSRGRLREILESPERFSGLDKLYRGVLDLPFQDETNERVLRLLPDMLGTIITCTPIHAHTLANLCCNNGDEVEGVMELILEECLPRLASLFLVSKDSAQIISVSHPSVIDFFKDKNRCTDLRFYVDLKVQEPRILDGVIRCLRIQANGDQEWSRLRVEVLVIMLSFGRSTYPKTRKEHDDGDAEPVMV